MKLFFTLALALASLSCLAQFTTGENPGYYGTQYTDQQIYDLMYASGARCTRSTLSVQFYLQYGISTYVARMEYPYLSKGMRGNVFNLTATAGPNYTGMSDTSWIPAGLYLAPFNSDGSINTNNGWAKYCYDIVTNIGAYFDYFEVWNEPDLTKANPAVDWATREPLASELPNMKATVKDYVQLCKIANQVIKKYQPAAKICTGGLGYPNFYKWFVHDGGLPWIDVNSFHKYPYYDWTLFTGNHRNSDYAAADIDTAIAQFRAIDNTKAMMITETNIPRWSYVDSSAQFPNNKQWGADQTQTDFTLKVISHAANAGLQLMTFYQAGETGDSGMNDGTAKSEIDAMGVYKDLVKATPGKEVMTNSGRAMLAYTTLLGNYKIDTSDKSRPAGVDFSFWDSTATTKKAYLIWAVTTKDRSEQASAVFEFPDKGQYDVFDCYGKFLRLCSDTIHLTGVPNFCKQHYVPLALVPPPPRRDTVANIEEVKIFPIPAHSYFNITLGSKINGKVSIQAYDAVGRIIPLAINSSMKNSFYFSVQEPVNVPAGIYFIRIDIAGIAETRQKIIVIK